jgi:hypothetical protein
MKKVFLTGVLVFFSSLFLAADDEKPFVLVSPLEIEGLSADEARIIETLIYSYINNLGETLDAGDSPDETGFNPAPRNGRTPDYTFSGSVAQTEDSLILTLEIGETGTGERASFTSVYKTTGELVLNVRSMVESAFAGKNPAAGPLAERTEGNDYPAVEREGEPLTERSVTGTWRGEPGIALIRLRRGGQGVAVFSSGAQMNLFYSIENNVLNVAQNSPNTERYYYRQGSSPVTIPYLVAKRLADEAEPMRWELSLYEDGTVLRGIKTATGIGYDLGNLVEITHGTIYEVEWTRTGR